MQSVLYTGQFIAEMERDTLCNI